MKPLLTLIFLHFFNVLFLLIPLCSCAYNNSTTPGFIVTPTSNTRLSYLNSMSAFQVDIVKTQGAPSPRGGHTAVVIGDSMYVFGGCYLDTTCYNDIFAYNVLQEELQDFRQDTWKQVVIANPKAVLPKPRKGHTATVIGDIFVIIGGTSVDGALLSDSWMFKTKQSEWERVLATGNSISGLSNHGAQLDSEGRIIIYGGIQDDGTQSSTVYILDFLAKKWTTPTIGLNPGTVAPEEREGFVTAYYNNRFFIYGGRNSTGYTSDLYALDSKTLKWSQGQYEKALFVSPDREEMAFARSGRILFLCGGCNSGLKQCYNNCFMLDLSSLDVNRVSFFNQNPINATQDATMALYGGTMLYFGGCQFLKSCTNQLVIFNTGNICPEKCFNHGVCDQMSLGRCKCDSRFQGTDCMYPVLCRNDCSNAGVCIGFSVCSCFPGYKGNYCETKVNCPGNCTSAMQGTCQPNGQCKCNTYYTSSPDCSIDTRTNMTVIPSNKTKVLIQTEMSQQNNSTSNSSSSQTSEANQHMHRVAGTFDTPSSSSSSKVQMTHVCPNSCSNLGLCKNSTCYCQPGYGGKDCSVNLSGNLNSGVRAKTMIFYFVGVFVLGFVMGSFLCRYFIVRSLSNEYEVVSTSDKKRKLF